MGALRASHPKDTTSPLAESDFASAVEKASFAVRLVLLNGLILMLGIIATIGTSYMTLPTWQLVVSPISMTLILHVGKRPLRDRYLLDAHEVKLRGFQTYRLAGFHLCAASMVETCSFSMQKNSLFARIWT
ncbi:hypothetical protein GGS21DRAFT_515766 [Xylaria nigripes]|nr:hypothetical protein GGS21DRAFT_515766 [Xylaria nigripes]